MRRSAVSMVSNIAEGAGRRSAKDIRHFLLIARGSASELEAQAILSHRLGFLDADSMTEIALQADEVRAMLFGLGRNLIGDRDENER
jgi:four helix bundle protein